MFSKQYRSKNDRFSPGDLVNSPNSGARLAPLNPGSGLVFLYTGQCAISGNTTILRSYTGTIVDILLTVLGPTTNRTRYQKWIMPRLRVTR